FCCYRYPPPPHLPSFPTRRSSDLRVGNPDQLKTDVGPVIDVDARDNILRHIEAMQSAGHRVDQVELDPGCRYGTFVPPTLIEIEDRKSTRLNSSHVKISYAVFCLK